MNLRHEYFAHNVLTNISRKCATEDEATRAINDIVSDPREAWTIIRIVPGLSGTGEIIRSGRGPLLFEKED